MLRIARTSSSQFICGMNIVNDDKFELLVTDERKCLAAIDGGEHAMPLALQQELARDERLILVIDH